MCGAFGTSDPACVFTFEPISDVQMGRHRSGYRVRTAQNHFLVALLGRRCSSRLVPAADVPTPGTERHAKFFQEQTNMFEIDLATGALRFLHHSSQDDDDVFFFSFAGISTPDLVAAEIESMSKGTAAAADWKYLSIQLF